MSHGHAIDLHVHESCMYVAVRVLHSCAFIIDLIPLYYGMNIFSSELGEDRDEAFHTKECSG